MARQFAAIGDDHRAFIERQHIFFVASAAAGSRVNLSPRSTAELRITGAHSAAYLDRTGSGNETAAHIRAGGRVTIMLCAFEGAPLILRLYGVGEVLRHDSPEFQESLREHFAESAPLGSRQIVTLSVELVQTSCGFGVPMFDYCEERTAMDRWAANKGADGIAAYWREKNVRSIDGLPTGLLDEVGR